MPPLPPIISSMFTPKYINITLAIVASSAVAVGAFTTTRTSFSPTSVCAPVLQPRARASFVSTPLQLLKKDMAATEVEDQPLLKAVENPADIDNGKNNDVPTSTIAFIGSSLLSFAYVMQRLQIYLNTPCLNGGPGGSTICDASYYDFAMYFKEHEIISFLLVLTHVIPFVLLPWVSKQVSEVGPTIKKDFEGFNPFISKYLYRYRSFPCA